MMPENETQKWEIAVDRCAAVDCGEPSFVERRFDWQIAGATFLQIYLPLCADHATTVDSAGGAPFPVSCTLGED